MRPNKTFYRRCKVTEPIESVQDLKNEITINGESLTLNPIDFSLQLPPLVPVGAPDGL
jgi:hypothetical protein